MFASCGTQCGICMRHTVICGLSGCTIFFHTISLTVWFSKKKRVTEHFLYKFIWHIPHSKKNGAKYDQKRICLHVQYPLFLSDFNETWIFSTDFLKILKNQISRKSMQWKPRWSKRTGGQTDMKKLLVAFRNFAKLPNKKGWRIYHALRRYTFWHNSITNW